VSTFANERFVQAPSDLRSTGITAERDSSLRESRSSPWFIAMIPSTVEITVCRSRGKEIAGGAVTRPAFQAKSAGLFPSQVEVASIGMQQATG
jgi:hypothetical protein